MLLLDVQCHDFLENLVERDVGVCHNQGSLLREVVVDVRNDLSCHVSLAGTWRTNNHCKAWLHTCTNGFNLETIQSDAREIELQR